MPFFSAVLGSKDLVIVYLIVSILLVIIVPLPPIILDLFLTVSISLSVLIILIAIYVPKPTDLSTFPTFLLIVVMFRLGLNIATTRMILSNGHNGVDSVSQIISAFGEFVVGGNFVIGIIIFIVLVLTNFMVVSNGTTRVAEVTARFKLDSIPGRQLAIDADFNAGVIDQEEMKERRKNLDKELDFYGSMDGSTKFIKGDAVAGIVITLINIIGGILIGVFQHDMTVSDSASTFTILTVGDGIISQIPALMTSVATGIMVTRGSLSDDQSFSSSLVDQISKESRALIIVGLVLNVFAFIPGFPTLSLMFVGGIFIVAGLVATENKEGLYKMFPFMRQLMDTSTQDSFSDDSVSDTDEDMNEEEKATKKSEEEKEEIDKALSMQVLEISLGHQLLALADDNSSSGDGVHLLDRIRGIRTNIAQKFGFLVPSINISDDLQLESNEYKIFLKGVEIGGSALETNMFMAINTGMVADEIEGVPTKEPAFGLDALWVSKDKKTEAIERGYTIVDPSTIMATHIEELIKKYAEELLTRQDIQKLLERLKVSYPALVEEISAINIGIIQGVLRSLLHEKVPIKDLVTILEIILDLSKLTQEVPIITEQVRIGLSRTITDMYKDTSGKINMLMLDTMLEQTILTRINEHNQIQNLGLSAEEISALIDDTKIQTSNLLNMGISPAIIMVEPAIRKQISDIYEKFLLDVVVLSHAEIDTSASFEVMGKITLQSQNMNDDGVFDENTNDMFE